MALNWTGSKIDPKSLYSLDEDEYRNYMREQLSRARREMDKPRKTSSTLLNLLVGMLLAGAIGLVMLHHIGHVEFDAFGALLLK